MHVKRRRLPNFESCSVALFASLVFGGTSLPARAQMAAPSTRSAPSSNPSAASAPSTLPVKTRARHQPSTTTAAPAAADLPDGSVSSAAFDEALK